MLNVKKARNSPFKYFAFISYVHEKEDEEFASWLQKKIETFWLPRRLRNELNGFPKKIYPVFRDKTDLLPKNLNEETQENLAASKYLIVICSPRSAIDKRYVQHEVDDFIRLRSVENIIPVIIEGNAQSEASEAECFCPALLNEREKKILPADVDARFREKKEKKQAHYTALLKIIALLTGNSTIDFPIRVNRWTKNRERMRIAISSFLTILLIAAAIFAWNYYVPKTHYYSDYVTEWGVPKGIGEFSRDEVSHMYAHYEITTERGRVSKLEYANSAGNPAGYLNDEWGDRPQIARYYYRDDGLLNYVEMQDGSGNVVSSQVYSTDLRFIDFQVNKQNSTASTLIRQFSSTGHKAIDPVDDSLVIHYNSDITRYYLTYNSKGQIINVMFQRDNRGTPSVDAYGISGIRYELDEDGRINTKWFLNRDGEVIYDGIGVAGQRFEYPEKGMPVRIMNIGMDGENRNSRQGWSVKSREFDCFGNVILTQFTDVNGKPAYYKSGSTAYSGICKTYSDAGFLTSNSYYNTNKELMCCSEGYAIEKYINDAEGRRTATSYYDQAAAAVCCSGNYHTIRRRISEDGLTFYESYFDINDQPINLSSGLGLFVVTCDSSGRLLTEEYYDKNGNPILNAEGIHKRIFRYNAIDQIIDVSFFGVQDEPIAIQNQSFQGVHETRFKYDENGNVAEMEFHNSLGEPTTCGDGYYSIKSIFSNSGNLVEETLWDIYGAPASGKSSGYHKKTIKYDENENPVEIAIYGSDGQPTVIPGTNVWKLVSKYDEFGFIQSTSNYGVHGEPAYTPLSGYGGWFRADCLRDEKGNIVEERFYDEDGKPCLCQAGYAIRRDEYDEEGTNIIRHSYFDVEGYPVLSADGYASATYENDIYGNTIKKSCFGTDGRLIISKDDFAICMSEYDYSGRTLSMEFYDTDGRPMLCDNSYFRITWNYLSDGSQEIKTFLTESAYKDGRYGTYYLFDEDDNCITQKSINSEGKIISE